MKGRLLERLDRTGPALLAVVIAVSAVIYVQSAYASSSRIHNIIFVVPMAAIAVLLASIVLLRAVLKARAGKATLPAATANAVPPAEPRPEPAPEVGPLGIIVMMLLMLGYAAAIPFIGFDVASMVFMAACLWVQGERRIPFVAAYSVVYALAITWLLLNGARIPAHTLIL